MSKPYTISPSICDDYIRFDKEHKIMGEEIMDVLNKCEDIKYKYGAKTLNLTELLVIIKKEILLEYVFSS